MGDTSKQTAFRLDARDRNNIKRLIRAGIAKDATAAVKIALEVAPMGVATKLLSDVEQLGKRARELADTLDQVRADRLEQFAPPRFPGQVDPAFLETLELPPDTFKRTMRRAR